MVGAPRGSDHTRVGMSLRQQMLPYTEAFLGAATCLVASTSRPVAGPRGLRSWNICPWIARAAPGASYANTSVLTHSSGGREQSLPERLDRR